MKKYLAIILMIFFFVLNENTASAQCSVCTRTAEQMGEKPARALNTGILYLMLAPFAIAGYIGYRWWKDNRS